MTATPLHVTSRDNPLLVRLRKLSQDGNAYRKLDEIWLEGDHLCRAAVQRGRTPMQAVITEEAWQDARLRELAEQAPRIVIVPAALFRGLSALESPAAIGFAMPLQADSALRAGCNSVVLDRLQDAGNAGSILRSAAALGVEQVIALQGTVALWSPKVLRAGMGAHFALHLVEAVAPDALEGLGVPLIAASSHAATSLPSAALAEPCAWIFGHEGQGVSEALMRACGLTVRIPQPGGEESLNVASAAAICLYESARRRLAVAKNFNTRAGPA